jgi:hypothetical protein
MPKMAFVSEDDMELLIFYMLTAWGHQHQELDINGWLTKCH